MKFPKKETMKKYVKGNSLNCKPAENCPICNRIRAYKKELRRTK